MTTKKPVHIDVTLKPGYWIDPSVYFKQISDAGYAARKDEVKLTMTGKLSRDGDRLLFTMDDVKPGPETFRVIEGTSKDTKEQQAMKAAYKTAFDSVDRQVLIEGWWKPPADKKDKAAAATLVVTKVEPVKT